MYMRTGSVVGAELGVEIRIAAVAPRLLLVRRGGGIGQQQ